MESELPHKTYVNEASEIEVYLQVTYLLDWGTLLVSPSEVARVTPLLEACSSICIFDARLGRISRVLLDSIFWCPRIVANLEV